MPASRPAAAAAIAPRGWTLDDPARSPISADDAARADRAIASGRAVHADRLTIHVPDARVAVRLHVA